MKLTMPDVSVKQSCRYKSTAVYWDLLGHIVDKSSKMYLYAFHPFYNRCYHKAALLTSGFKPPLSQRWKPRFIWHVFCLTNQNICKMIHEKHWTDVRDIHTSAKLIRKHFSTHSTMLEPLNAPGRATFPVQSCRCICFSCRLTSERFGSAPV